MHQKQTKIVATIGPVTQDVETLRKLINEGMNVARLNFSHSDHIWHREAIENIRQASKKQGVPIAIIADLQGPRIRTVIEEEFTLTEGDEVVMCESKNKIVLQTKNSIAFDKESVLEQLAQKQRILIEDGKIVLEVKSVNATKKILKASVITGGTIKLHKGMNFPGAGLKLSTLTKKDLADLAFACEEGVEYVALSFVGSAEDVDLLRAQIAKYIPDEAKQPKIIVKIERQEAIKNLKEIIHATDAVLVARGDLATEAGQEKVGVLQKAIIDECILQARPVIMATQMLESMMENAKPTRAEISDVTNAVIDHVDATMLSGETAGGKYPVECVRTMREIIEQAEASPYDDVYTTFDSQVPTEYIKRVQGAYEMARSSGSKMLLGVTRTGESAVLLAHFRPQIPVIFATDNMLVHRQLSLVWGLQTILLLERSDEERMLSDAIDHLAQKRELVLGEKVVCIYRSKVSGNKTVELRKMSW